MKLLLFDIDGTLVLTHGAGRRSVEKALLQVFGRHISTADVPFSGKTDPQILLEVMEIHGYDPSTVNGHMTTVAEAYMYHLRRELKATDVEVLPGVADLLDQLGRRTDVQLGLLTGNLEPMAYLKLELAGLDRFFAFGAFGSDNPDRYQLPPIALDRARAHTGHPFEGSDVVIIGDTEHDIACGRGIGARSVAVCTGRFAETDLAAHGPDVLFEDLTDGELFCRRVL